MKKFSIIFTIAFLAFCSLHAQNWAPIHAGNQYYFRENDGTEAYLRLVQVDSASVENGDSVFHLNRVFIPCPDCLVFLCDTLVQEGQFLQRTMTKQADGSYLLSGLHELLLKANAPLNTTWTLDAVNGIDATITEVAEEMVLNQMDSVKNILLSNGLGIKLSKNFGLLEMPDFSDANKFYELIGIPTKGLGVSLPDYKRVFDYHVGDVLQYKFHRYHYTPASGTEDITYYTKMKVLDRMDFSDSIVYTLEKQYYGNIDTLTPPYQVAFDTISWQVSASSVKQTKVLQNTFTSFLYEEEPFHEYGLNEPDFYTTLSFPLDGNNRVSMHYDYTNAAMQDGWLHLDSTNLYLYDTVAHCPFAETSHANGFLYFAEGKGVTRIAKSFSQPSLNSYKEVEMVGSIINNDSMGIVLPDGIQNDSLTPTPPAEFALLSFPNPIKSNQIELVFNKTIDSQLQLTVANSMGQQILIETIPANSDSIDLFPSDWPSGYYFLLLQGPGVNIKEKILKWGF